jgi:glycosyltransferase involved in cell wall biosynthesis
MKKIVYLLDLLNTGGAELQIAETISRLNRDIFDPKLYCISGWESAVKAFIEERGVDITVFNTPSGAYPNGRPFLFSFLRKFLALYHYLKQEQPDIVHCCMYIPSIYGGIAAKLAGNPVLITNRVSLGYFKDSKPHYQLIENFVNRFTDGVIVNARAVKNDVLMRENVDPDKIYIIYNGVDTEKYKPLEMRPELRPYLLSKKRELGIPETARVIGMIANLIPYKGYNEFLVAASEIQRHYPDTCFLCIGEDRGIRKQLEQLARELGIYQQVIFTSAPHGVPDLIHLIDIQVSASLEEGFSNAILEGMAAGKPIVAASVGGASEAMVHDVTGILIPPNNAEILAQEIMTLLRNPERAAGFGFQGRKRVETHFFMQRLIDNLEKLYFDLDRKKTKGKPF